MTRLLVVTTVPSTLNAFLLPYAEHFRSLGWQVDAATGAGPLPARVAAAFDQVHAVPWSRSVSPAQAPAALLRVRGLLPAYDLVHTHTPIASFLTRMAAGSLPPGRRPALVYTAHGFHFQAGGRPVTNAVYTAAEWVAGRVTDRLVVLTPTDEVAARRRHLAPAARTRVLPGVGVDLEHYAPAQGLLDLGTALRAGLGIPPEAPLFTVVAALDPGKNHVAALRALVQVPDAHLVCAGSGPEREQLLSLAAELGISDRVHLVGSLQDVRPLVLASTATVLPSRREGLSRSVLESLALGVPVLGSRVRGIAELVPVDGGVLVEPDDVDGLAAAMRAAGHFPRPQALRVVLEPHLRAFALPRLLAQHERLYRELLQETGRGTAHEEPARVRGLLG